MNALGRSLEMPRSRVGFAGNTMQPTHTTDGDPAAFFLDNSSLSDVVHATHRNPLRQPRAKLHRRSPTHRNYQPVGSVYADRISSDAFSAIITVGACVLPETMVGMIEASTTRRRSMPCTFSSASTTECASAPIFAVPTG